MSPSTVVNTDLGRFLLADSALGGVDAVVAGTPMKELYAATDPKAKALAEAVLGTFMLPTDRGANTQVSLAHDHLVGSMPWKDHSMHHPLTSMAPFWYFVVNEDLVGGSRRC